MWFPRRWHYDGVNLSVNWETAPYAEEKIKLIVDGYLDELLTMEVKLETISFIVKMFLIPPTEPLTL